METKTEAQIRADERERCARFTEDLAMLVLAEDADGALTRDELVAFLQVHADDLRRWDGETYAVVDAPGVDEVIAEVKAVMA